MSATAAKEPLSKFFADAHHGYWIPIRICRVGVDPVLYSYGENGELVLDKKNGRYNIFGDWYKEPVFWTGFKRQRIPRQIIRIQRQRRQRKLQLEE
jgi:hypothetical protein